VVSERKKHKIVQGDEDCKEKKKKEYKMYKN